MIAGEKSIYCYPSCDINNLRYGGRSESFDASNTRDRRWNQS